MNNYDMDDNEVIVLKHVETKDEDGKEGTGKFQLKMEKVKCPEPQYLLQCSLGVNSKGGRNNVDALHGIPLYTLLPVSRTTRNEMKKLGVLKTVYTQELNPFDEVAYAAICSEMYQQIRENTYKEIILNPKTLYKTIYGAPASSEEQVNKIEETIKKLWTTTIKIVTEPRYRKKDGFISYSGSMLDVMCMRYTHGQIEDRVYTIPKKMTPHLYTECAQLNQINIIPISLLNIPGLKMMEENVLLRYFLLRELYRMEHWQEWKEVLTEDELFAQCDICCNGKDEREEYRRSIRLMLDFWKENGWFKDYIITDMTSGNRAMAFLF